MKKKSAALLSSCAAIAVCSSLIVGSTYALFTSESKVNIAVTSGKVEVVAEVDETSLTSNLYEGTATLDEAAQTLTIQNMIPMDSVEFGIVVTNNSSVTVQYRTVISVAEDNGLFDGLEVTINNEEGLYAGTTIYSDWAELSAGVNPDTVNVKIALPESAGNEYQDKNCIITYGVEAVQGNAEISVPDADLIIYTARDLIAFGESVNAGNTYAGETVMLANDIDLGGATLEPIGTVLYNKDASANQGVTTNVSVFAGTFDGDNHTISNYVYDAEGVTGAGLFGYVASANATDVATVKNVNINNVNYYNAPYSGAAVGVAIGNVTVENVNVENYSAIGSRQMGGIVGYANRLGGNNTVCQILNCSVKNISVTAVPELLANGEYDNGDKVGGILGYEQNAVTISGCTVENATLTAYRDLAGIVGMLQYNTSAVDLTNNTVNGVNLIVDTYTNAYGKTEAETVGTANGVYGRKSGTGTYAEDVNVSNVTVSQTVKN